MDDKMIISNEYIKHLKTIPLLFTTHVFRFSIVPFEGVYRLYRPLYMLSFAMDYRIWGLNPFGYRLTNVIIHSLNAFLVFFLIYKLFSNYPLALLTSILFCIHPLHTESVCFISGRAELWVSLFTLLSLIFYINYAISLKGLSYFLSLLSFIFALLSKEAGFLVFVPVFVAILGLKSKIPKNSIIFHFLSFIGIFAIYMILRLTVLVPMQLPFKSPYPFFWDILNFLRVLIEYIKLFIFPYSLHIFRSIMPISSFSNADIISPILFLFSLLIITIVSIKRKKYVLLSGISWFILMLLYLISFLYYKDFRCVSMEEHWAYLASIGFFLILAYLILTIKRPKLITIVSIPIVVIYGVLTNINSSHWKEEMSFYRYNLEFIEAPLSIIPRLEFMDVLTKRGLYKEALDEAAFVLSTHPQNWIAYLKRGDTLRAMRKFPEAKEAYQNALKIDYFCWQANQRLKSLAEESGGVYKEEVDPALSPLEAKIVSLIRMGDFDQALYALSQAISASPTPNLYTFAGITFGKLGSYDKAIEAFNAALKIDQKYPPALQNLAIAYENKNLPEKAFQVRETIKQIK